MVGKKKKKRRVRNVSNERITDFFERISSPQFKSNLLNICEQNLIVFRALRNNCYFDNRERLYKRVEQQRINVILESDRLIEINFSHLDSISIKQRLSNSIHTSLSEKDRLEKYRKIINSLSVETILYSRPTLERGNKANQSL